MNNKNNNNVSGVKKYLPLALSAALIVTGLLCIAAVCHLFFTGGDQPYTRERVGEYLALLILPSIITLILGISSAVACRAKDADTYKGKALDIFKARASLKKLKAGFDYDGAPSDVKEKIAAIGKRTKRSLILASSVTFFALAASLAVVFDFGRYTVENLNSDIASSAALILANALLSLTAWLIFTLTRASAVDEEMALIRAAVKEEPSLYKKPENEGKPSLSDNTKVLFGIRCAILALALVFIVLGIFNGGMADVLDKAVKICTECIGLG